MDLIGVRFCFSFPMGFPLNVWGDGLFFGYGPTGYFQIGAEVAANAGPRIVGVAFDAKK